MSVTTELARIQTAKDDIKTAIENKGVSVPSNTLIDDYSTYVDSIQAGGVDQNVIGLIDGNITGTLVIDNGITKIKAYACFYMTGLTNITIPASVTSIENYAFFNCNGLQSVTIYATTPPTLASYIAFNNTANCPIYVPAGSVDTYKAATNWKNSKIIDRIQAIPT